MKQNFEEGSELRSKQLKKELIEKYEKMYFLEGILQTIKKHILFSPLIFHFQYQLIKRNIWVKPQNRTVPSSTTMKHSATKLVLPFY